MDDFVKQKTFEDYREKAGARMGELEKNQAVTDNKIDMLVDAVGQLRLTTNTVLETTKDLSLNFALLAQKVSYAKFIAPAVVILGGIIYGAVKLIKG